MVILGRAERQTSTRVTKFLKLFEWGSLFAAILALLAIMSLTTTSVIGRYIFNTPVPDDVIASEMLLVAVVFLPFGYVQARREHVFVGIFTNWLSTRARLALDAFGVIVGAVIFGIIACAVWTDFHAAYKVGAYVDGTLEIPEWPARFVAFFGLAMFALRLFVDSIVDVVGFANYGTAVPDHDGMYPPADSTDAADTRDRRD